MLSTAYHTNYDNLISCKDNIFTKKFMEVCREWGEFYLNILTSDNIINDKHYYNGNINVFFNHDYTTLISGNRTEYPIPESIRRSVSMESIRLLEPLIFFRNSTFYPDWKFKDFGYISPEEETSDSSFSVLDSLIHDVYHNNLFFITGEKEEFFKNRLKKLTVFVFKPDLLGHVQVGQFRFDKFLNLLTQVLMSSDISKLISKLINTFGKDIKDSLYDFGYLDTYFYEYLSKGDIHPYRKIVNRNFEYHIDTVNLLKSACQILDEFGNDEEEENKGKPNVISLTLNLDNRCATVDIFKFTDKMGYLDLKDKMIGLIATTDKFKWKFSSTLLEILHNHTVSLFKTVESDYTDKIVHSF